LVWQEFGELVVGARKKKKRKEKKGKEKKGKERSLAQ